MSEQGTPHPLQNDSAHVPSDVLSSSPPPTDDDEKPSFNFEDSSDKRFMFSGLAAARGRQHSHTNADIFTVLVDRDAPNHLVGDY